MKNMNIINPVTHRDDLLFFYSAFLCVASSALTCSKASAHVDLTMPDRVTDSSVLHTVKVSIIDNGLVYTLTV